MFRWCDCDAFLCAMCDITFKYVAHIFCATAIAILKKRSCTSHRVNGPLDLEKQNHFDVNYDIQAHVEKNFTAEHYYISYVIHYR